MTHFSSYVMTWVCTGNGREKLYLSSSVLIQQVRFKTKQNQRFKAPSVPKEKEKFVSRKRW